MAERGLPKVLVVEDHYYISEPYIEKLAGVAEVLVAENHQTARKLFAAHQGELRAIVMDACLGGHEINTLDLVGEFRQQGFRGPMLATSTISNYRQQLMGAGCSIDVHEKEWVPDTLKEELSKLLVSGANPEGPISLQACRAPVSHRLVV